MQSIRNYNKDNPYLMMTTEKSEEGKRLFNLRQMFGLNVRTESKRRHKGKNNVRSVPKTIAQQPDRPAKCVDCKRANRCSRHALNSNRDIKEVSHSAAHSWVRTNCWIMRSGGSIFLATRRRHGSASDNASSETC